MVARREAVSSLEACGLAGGAFRGADDCWPDNDANLHVGAILTSFIGLYQAFGGAMLPVGPSSP